MIKQIARLSKNDKMSLDRAHDAMLNSANGDDQRWVVRGNLICDTEDETGEENYEIGYFRNSDNGEVIAVAGYFLCENEAYACLIGSKGGEYTLIECEVVEGFVVC